MAHALVPDPMEVTLWESTQTPFLQTSRLWLEDPIIVFHKEKGRTYTWFD